MGRWKVGDHVYMKHVTGYGEPKNKGPGVITAICSPRVVDVVDPKGHTFQVGTNGAYGDTLLPLSSLAPKPEVSPNEVLYGQLKQLHQEAIQECQELRATVAAQLREAALVKENTELRRHLESWMERTVKQQPQPQPPRSQFSRAFMATTATALAGVIAGVVWGLLW